MKKDVEHISVNTVRANFPLHKQMALHTYLKQPSWVFCHAAVQDSFGNTSGRVLMLIYSFSHLISLQINSANG